MGTARLNIWLRNSECQLLTSCWRTDLVIQTCSNTPIKDSYPEIIDQLKMRYSQPGYVQCISDFPLMVNQSGKTLAITVGSSTTETLTFASAMTLVECYAQIKAFFKNVDVSLFGNTITLTTIDRGPGATIMIGGDCDLVWGPIVNGSGYTITSHYYQNAWRLMLYPGGGKTLNHIIADIPPGCYKVWTRVCHGNNEETSMVMANAKCDDHLCVNLLLPVVKTCSAQLLHPMMDQIVHQQFLLDDAERLLPFRALMWAAGIGREDVIAQLDYRIQEAQDKGDTELEARIIAVKNLALLLPACY